MRPVGEEDQEIRESGAYRFDIDGLRAIAVCAVLLYHADLGCPGGFVGVDVFFVISGFLITRLLVSACSTGIYSPAQFWERRVRRLLPALTVVGLATTLASFWLLLPDHLESFGKYLCSNFFMGANFYFWRAMTGGYFADPAEQYPSLHTWSLAVEEQFYLLYPLALTALLRRKYTNRKLLAILSGILCLSMMPCIALSPSHKVLAFFLLPTRAWELLAGAACVFIDVRKIGQLKATYLGWLGAALVLVPMAVYSHSTSFPGYAAVSPCLGTSLIILSGCGNYSTPLKRLLGTKVFVSIGQISYSLYLWHWPLLAFLQYSDELAYTPQNRLFVVLLSFVLATLSWAFIETPCRRLQLFGGRKRIFLIAFGVAAANAAVGCYLCWRHGLPERWPVISLKLSEATKDQANVTDVSVLEVEKDKYPRLGDLTASALSFAVWGDSHAMALAPLFDQLGKKYHVQGLQLTHSSTPPLLTCPVPGIPYALTPEQQVRYVRLFKEYVQRENIKCLFLVARWSKYQSVAFSTDLSETIKDFSAVGCKLYIVKDVPSPNFKVPKYLAFQARWSRSLKVELPLYKQEQSQQFLTDILDSQRDGFALLDPIPYFDDGTGNCSLVSEGRCLFRDGDHLSGFGATKLVPMFEPVFQREFVIRNDNR